MKRKVNSTSEILRLEVLWQPLFIVSHYPPTSVELLGDTLFDFGPGAVWDNKESRPNATAAGLICVLSKPRPRNRHDGMPLRAMRWAKEHIDVEFGGMPKPRHDVLWVTAESPLDLLGLRGTHVRCLTDSVKLRRGRRMERMARRNGGAIHAW